MKKLLPTPKEIEKSQYNQGPEFYEYLEEIRQHFTDPEYVCVPMPPTEYKEALRKHINNCGWAIVRENSRWELCRRKFSVTQALGRVSIRSWQVKTWALAISIFGLVVTMTPAPTIIPAIFLFCVVISVFSYTFNSYYS